MKLIIEGFLLLLLVSSAMAVVATGPIELSPNTENSPSVYLLPFTLSQPLPISGYVLVVLNSYASNVLPTSCKLINTTISVACDNLASPAGYISGLSISASSINTVNPNINSGATVVLDMSTVLTANTNYYLQIVLSNVIPSIQQLSDSIEFYTVSYNSIIYEQNWNYGQVLYLPRQTNTMTVSLLSALNAAVPGSSSIFKVDITISQAITTIYSRIKIVLPDPFVFSLSSIVSSANDASYASSGGLALYAAPNILYSQILTPNIIITTFNEQFVIGRRFVIQITAIQNPFSISTSIFSIYSLNFNSMSPLESYQQNSNLAITTVPFPLTVNVMLPQNMPFLGPMQLYIGQFQYISVTVVASQSIPVGYAMILNIPAVYIVAGSAYANTSTTNASTVIYNYTSTTLVISNFASIPAGSTIQVSLKVKINSAAVVVTANIDQYSNINTVTPLYTGYTTVTAITPAAFMVTNYPTSSGGQNNVLNYMQSTTSTIVFDIYPTDSSTGSSIEMVTSAYVTTTAFSSSTSCSVYYPINATNTTIPAAYCVAQSLTNYLNITVSSSGSNNYFPVNTYAIVTITGLSYTAASSHTNYIYQLFFRFNKSKATNPTVYTWMSCINVLPQRGRMANLGMTISNDIYNTGINYPNALRIVSTNANNWTFTIQLNQVRLLTVFAFNGFQNLGTMYSLNNYPCASNLNVQCVYTQGDQSLSAASDLGRPLDWDRIDIFLPGTQNTTNFHVVIPENFPASAGTPYYYQVMAGKYNTQTRQYTYMQILPRFVTGSTTITPSVTTMSAKTNNISDQVQLTGKAGSYISSVEIDVFPSVTYTANTNSAALFIVSTWPLFSSASVLETLTSNNSIATFGTNEQSPLFLSFSTNYLAFIPFTLSSSSPWSVLFDNMHLPYTYDLPYYSMYITNSAGIVDSYNEFINQNAGVFYYSVLKSLSISCIDNSLGVLNTVCFINFQNNNEIVYNGKIYIDFSGMTTATSYCYLTYTTNIISNTSIPVTCSSTSNQTQLIVALPSTPTVNYPNTNNAAYSLTIYGVGITSTSISQFITLTLRDSSGSYIIETGTRLLTTTVQNTLSVSISQITYQFNNPLVQSNMYIAFSLPRQLYLDQTFVILLGKDLSDSNTLVQKLNIQLYNNGVLINTIQSLSSTSYKLTFTVTNPSLIVAGNYTLNMYGLQIPASNANDLLYIIYQRNFDNLYTLINTVSTTSPFPALNSKINSLITMSSYFNTQGLEQWLVFTLTNQNTLVDSNMIWYINFPIYYSSNLWTDSTLIYCQISGVKLPCIIDPNVPYQLQVMNSPRLINNGTSYTISVFGLPCPRKIYLNNNGTYANQYIFIGAAQNSSSTSYVQYTQLYPYQSIMDAAGTVGYGLVQVSTVTSSSLNSFSSSYVSITMVCSSTIASGSYLYITFPQEWNNFNDIALQVLVNNASNSALLTTTTANVVNRRVQILLSSGITSSSSFIISFQNIPTPKSPCVTDMNNLQVLVASSNKLTTSAASTIKTNTAPQLTFVSNSLYISFNHDSAVTITAGTYSLPISITSSDNNQFLSNIKISFTASGFTFNSNPTTINLGDSSGTFIIGADMSLLPTYYVYNIIKTQTSLVPYYTALTNNNIQVTNTQVSITVPSSLTIPIGGCSIPVMISLLNPPYNDLSISFVYNNTLYSPNSFFVNPQTTNSQLNFTSTSTYQWLSFCSASNSSATTVPITYVLGGTNYISYQLTTLSLNANIVAGVSNTTPSITITTINVLKTLAIFNLTVNTNGIVFYSLQMGNNITPMDPLSLKVQIKSLALILQSQSDFLTQIYTSDRDYRVNMLTVTTGNNQITFNNLFPQKAYTFCVYFQNQFNNTSNSTCKTFTTLPWGVVSRAYVTFSSTLQASQLNNILCFFVKEVSAKITNVIDIEGQSCSLSNSPQNYYYTYPGTTFSSQSTQATIYLMSNAYVTTDSSVTAFSNMFNSTNSITTTSLNDALSGFSINYISNATFQGTFNPNDALNLNNGFVQSITFNTPTYSNGVITIPNINLAASGGAYFILVLVKQISIDPISGASNVTIRLDSTPTAQQILNCQNWYGNIANGCARVILNSGESNSITFSGILSNSFYKLYYVLTNQYPLRPVVTGSVSSVTVVTIKWESILSICLLLLWLL